MQLISSFSWSMGFMYGDQLEAEYVLTFLCNGGIKGRSIIGYTWTRRSLRTDFRIRKLLVLKLGRSLLEDL